MTRDVLLKEALRLPVRDRADVAAELLASLDDTDAPDDLQATEKAWAIEIERRGRRVLAGDSAGLPWEEVRQRLEDRLTSK